MKNEETQRLLGNGSNAAKGIPTDSKTTKRKKGYSVVRLSTALGTFALSLLGVYFFAGRGGKINNNVVNNNIRSSSGKEIVHYCIDVGYKWERAKKKYPACIKGECPDNYPDNKRGVCVKKVEYCNEAAKGRLCIKDRKRALEDTTTMCPVIKSGICETTGTQNDVLPYLNHQEVIPGKIYYGLEFKDNHYQGITSVPHDPPKVGIQDRCLWGFGKSVGRCIRHGNVVDPDDYRCPSTQRKIVAAWQECAKLCNDQPDCHTFTVKTQAQFGHRDYHCYFHKSYECKSNHAGIDNYAKHDVKDDDLGVWGGICRTRSGRTNDYACTNTPHPCGMCSNKQLCCRNGGAFDFSCPNCGNGRI